MYNREGRKIVKNNISRSNKKCFEKKKISKNKNSIILNDKHFSSKLQNNKFDENSLVLKVASKILVEHKNAFKELS